MSVYLTTLYIILEVYLALTVYTYQCHNFTSLLVKIDILIILAKFRAYGPSPNVSECAEKRLWIERLPYNNIYYVEFYRALTVNTYECHDVPVHSHQNWQMLVFWSF